MYWSIPAVPGSWIITVVTALVVMSVIATFSTTFSIGRLAWLSELGDEQEPAGGVERHWGPGRGRGAPEAGQVRNEAAGGGPVLGDRGGTS